MACLALSFLRDEIGVLRSPARGPSPLSRISSRQDGVRVEREKQVAAAEAYVASLPSDFSELCTLANVCKCTNVVCKESGRSWSETWNAGQSFHCSMCKIRYTNPECHLLERALMEATLTLDKAAAPDDAAREAAEAARGVRVGKLKELLKQLPRPGMTAYEVVSEFIKPRTAAHRTRFVDLPDMKDDVGRAVVYVSHCMAAPFAHTVAAVAYALPDDVFVWLDVLAVRQWPGNDADLNLYSAIKNTAATLVCSVHLQELAELPLQDVLLHNTGFRRDWLEMTKPCVFFNPWNVLELHTSLMYSKPRAIVIGTTDAAGTFSLDMSMCTNLYHCINLDECLEQTPRGLALRLHTLLKENKPVDLTRRTRGAVAGAWGAVRSPALLAAALAMPAALKSACSEDKGESAEDRAVRLGEMLLAAAAAGATAAVQILLGAGAPLNSALPDERTALMLAAGSGHQKTTQALLHAGAAVEVVTSEGRSALCFAASGTHSEVVQLLISAGAQVEVQTQDGLTPLMEAAAGGNLHMINTLLRAGANANTATATGFTPLIMAAVNGNLDVVAALLEVGASVNLTTTDGATALMNAAARGSTEVVTLLLDAGADPNAVHAPTGMTALRAALRSGHENVAWELRERGAFE